MQGSSPYEYPALDVGSSKAALRTSDAVLARFSVYRVDALDTAAAQHALVDLPADETSPPRLVVFRTASPQARRLLREHGVSYAGDDGEWFLLAPPVYVERSAPSQAMTIAPSATVSPFALRASRIPRWLLLHQHDTPALGALAKSLELSEATVSRVSRSLAEDGLVELVGDERDTRVRRVRVRDAGGLLAAMERGAGSRRVVRQTWDLGALDVEEALDLWRTAARELPSAPYAASGVLAAATYTRAVEPATMLVWLRAEDLPAWRERLMADLSRSAPGTVTVQVTPDPFVLTLADERDGIRFADPVQIYIDCRLAGERALEAAEAVKRTMGW